MALIPFGFGVVLVMSSIEKISTVFSKDQKFSSWETDDLSVISLTFNKEGKSYVIPVSSDSKRLVATWPSFAPDSGWPEWVKILLLFAGVFGGVYIVYRIVRWARGKARHEAVFRFLLRAGRLHLRFA